MFNKNDVISIYKETLWPMRLLMYASGALPYQFNEYRKQKSKTKQILWRITHQMMVTMFVGWLSVLRFQRFHEVLYKESDLFSIGMDSMGYATLLIIHLIVYWENTWKAFHYFDIFSNFEQIRRKFDLLLKCKMTTSRLYLYATLIYCLLGFNVILTCIVILIRYIKSLNAVRLLLSQYSEFILKLKLTEYMLFLIIIMTMQMHLNAITHRYMNNDIANMEFMPEGAQTKMDILETFGVLQDIHRLLVANVNHIEDYFAWSLPMLLLKMLSETILTSYWIYFSVDFEISAYFQMSKFVKLLPYKIL